MPVDIQRVAKAAVEAALQQPTGQADVEKPRRRRLAGGRAVLVGAGLVTAARLIAGPKGREMIESIQRRIEESDWYGADGGAEGEAEEDFDDEGAEGEAEEDFDDGDYDEDLEDDGLEGDDAGLEDEGPGGEADEEPDDGEVEEAHPRWSGTRRVKGAAVASRGRQSDDLRRATR